MFGEVFSLCCLVVLNRPTWLLLRDGLLVRLGIFTALVVDGWFVFLLCGVSVEMLGLTELSRSLNSELAASNSVSVADLFLFFRLLVSVVGGDFCVVL